MDNAARPSGALVYSAAGGNLSDEQFERLKNELEAHYQGAANAGRPLLLEGGLDWKGLSLSPKDMDFVEAKHIAAREIALSFGVPPMLLGIPGDNTYSNYAEANRAFYRQTVVPLLSRIAAALGNWLGESFGGNLRLVPDLDEVPALSIEREALWKRVGEAGFLTDDEKREAAGYEPLPGSSFSTLLAKYSPDQPRVPAGSSDGGQWTSGGYAGGAANTDEGRVLSDENPDGLVPGAEYAQGHHVFPRASARKWPLSPEARKVFNDAVTGPLHGDPHGWSKEHEVYSRAVDENFERFLRDNKIQPEKMSGWDAKRFLNEIMTSNDPRIKNFNLSLYRRAVLYWLNRIPRGMD